MEKTRVELNEDNIENQKEEMGNVEDKVEDPKTGMMFNSIDVLMKFYTRYAKEKGFAVAKRTAKKGDDGEVRYVTVACNRGGKQRIRSSNPLKMRAQSKTDCKAKLRAVLCTNGRWVLNSIELDHNHGLSPGRSQFYECHRILQPHATRKLELNDRAEPLSVIDSSVSLNDGRKVRISYKGVPGAYSEDAALKAYSQCETVPYNKFEDAFKAVELWLADKTVLLIENSLGGSIHRNYDLLLRHKLHIVGEALAQSDIILSKLGATRENVNDTASAAQLVASNELRDAGAVASARAAEIYGLDILAERIQDDSDNITRYLVLTRDPIIPSTNKPFKTSIVFTLEEGPGVLFKALATFALRDINLTKLHCMDIDIGSRIYTINTQNCWHTES
ncbi:hypothetical protein ACSBR1_028271 [Camellia fascicularis]